MNPNRIMDITAMAQRFLVLAKPCRVPEMFSYRQPVDIKGEKCMANDILIPGKKEFDGREEILLMRPTNVCQYTDGWFQDSLQSIHLARLGDTRFEDADFGMFIELPYG